MGVRIESLTTARAVFYTSVQKSGPRLSIPAYLCELYGWAFDAPVKLQIERRGQVFTNPGFAMSSGYEIVAKADDEALQKILKPGSRVKVTVAP